MLSKFLELSIGIKIMLLAVPMIILGTVAGAIVSNNDSGEGYVFEIPDANSIVENVVLDDVIENEVIIENVIVEEKIEEEEEEKKEEKVKYKDKEIVIPKSKVSTANSSEDAEKSKKTGGSNVSQEQAQEMFENVGKKSMGIDVSQHQGKIDWAQVKASGVEFAIIRVGYRGQTAGGIYEDKNFKTNMNGAIANGIKVGVYFYSTAINETEALEEAAWVVKKIAPYSITYPVVYDFEDFNSKRCVNVDGAQATKNAQAYLSYVQANGYEPMMYANKSDITKRMSRSSFSCKFWLAHYTEQTDYTGNVNMWQYTSQGSVPGISGGVDMNIAYFNYGTVAAPKHTHDFNEEVKNSFKAPTCEEKGSKVMACSCGEKETKELEAIGHEFDDKDWKVTTEPTTKTEGVKTRKCKNCDKIETEKIKKLDSDKVIENTVVDNNNNNNNKEDSKVENTVVDKPVEKPTETPKEDDEDKTEEPKDDENKEPDVSVHNHNWVEETDKLESATCGKAGTRHFKCSDSACTETKTEVINATGEHSFGDNGKTCSTCGVNNPNYQEPELEPEQPSLDNTI